MWRNICTKQHDMAACAVDDQLNAIATVAVSDSNMSPLMPSKMGRLISSVHLWDAEMMTLFGTLLFPCPALTRDLRSIETVTSPPRNTLDSEGAKNTPQFADQPHSSTDADLPANVKAAYTASNESKARVNTAQRPVLVTALAFLSPYPLLAGASTGGAVAFWGVPDCLCIKVRMVVSGDWWKRSLVFKRSSMPQG